MKDTLKDRMLFRYAQAARLYTLDDSRRNGWTSKESQAARFKVLTQISCLQGKSLLDAGCGTGDLLAYLQEQNLQVNYRGIDGIAANVSDAEQKFGRGLFFHAWLRDYQPAQQFDFVVASGLFYLPSSDWQQEVKSNFHTMYSLCKTGMAVNFLSAHAASQVPGLKYTFIREIMPYVSALSDSFTVRHDYAVKNNDFTVYIFKNAFTQ